MSEENKKPDWSFIFMISMFFLLLLTLILAAADKLSESRKARLATSYWSSLGDNYCSMNGVGFFLENLYKLDQRLTYLEFYCPAGVQLSHIDLSPRFSLLNPVSREFVRPHSWSRFSFRGWGADIGLSDFTNAKFNQSNLERVIAFKGNFTGADFSYSILREAIFAATTLDSANLEVVHAHDASFRSASMTYANLQNGNFIGTHFSSADLRGADFTQANLERADFSEANLTGANFENAHVAGAIFKDADLAGASLELAEDLTCEQLESAKNPGPELLASLCAHKLPGR